MTRTESPVATRLDTIRQVRRLRHVAAQAGVFVVDAQGPQHARTFFSRAWLTTHAGVTYEALAEAPRAKAANGMAATALLRLLRTSEPALPLDYRPTYDERRALRERVTLERKARETASGAGAVASD